MTGGGQRDKLSRSVVGTHDDEVGAGRSTRGARDRAECGAERLARRESRQSSRERVEALAPLIRAAARPPLTFIPRRCHV